MGHHATQRKCDIAPRERQILRIAATGASNKEIARQLGISERTVEHLISRACQWLGCNNRIAAAVRAGIVRIA